MAKAPKKTYVILVNRYAMHEVRVDAHSYEDACRILQRKLRPDTLSKTEGGTVAAGPFWANPADEGDEWAVLCASPAPGQTHTPVLAWNGQKVIDSPVPPVAYEDSRKR